MTKSPDVREVLEAWRFNRQQSPAVIIGPYGHCLAPGHEGRIVSTMHGYALRAKGPGHEQ